MLQKLGHVFVTNFFLGFSVLSLGLVAFTMAHGLVLSAFSHLVMGVFSYVHHVLHMTSPLDDIEERYVAAGFQ
jgi:hypothetical protein